MNENGEQETEIKAPKGSKLTTVELLKNYYPIRDYESSEYMDEESVEYIDEEDTPIINTLIPEPISDPEATKSKGKYKDPKTGAYYNNLREYQIIQALYETRELEELEMQQNLLKKLFVMKKRKLAFNNFDNLLNPIIDS